MQIRCLLTFLCDITNHADTDNIFSRRCIGDDKHSVLIGCDANRQRCTRFRVHKNDCSEVKRFGCRLIKNCTCDGGDAPRRQKESAGSLLIIILISVTSLDYRILLEADFLVNSFDDHLAPEGIITFRNHVFRSESAISMLNDMWGLE